MAAFKVSHCEPTDVYRSSPLCSMSTSSQTSFVPGYKYYRSYDKNPLRFVGEP
jgi:hypothetical protein